jgi:hypothetical protein
MGGVPHPLPKANIFPFTELPAEVAVLLFPEMRDLVDPD